MFGSGIYSMAHFKKVAKSVRTVSVFYRGADKTLARPPRRLMIKFTG